MDPRTGLRGGDAGGAAGAGGPEGGSSLTDCFLEVRQFHETFGLGVAEKPSFPNDECLDWRKLMALEEAREIREALEESLPLHSLLREIVDYTYVSLGHLVTCGLLPVWVEPEPRPVAHPVELTDAVKVGLAFLFESNAEQVARALRLRHLPSLHWSAITGAFLGFRTFALLGLPERPFFIEVHEANMRKVRNPGGLRPVKPVGWRAPDLEAVLRNLSLK